MVSKEKTSELRTRIENFYEAQIQICVHPSRIESLELSREIAKNREESNNQDAFLLVNLDTLIDRYDMWMRELPGVMPFYAVKSNPSAVILRILAAFGVNFDCASRGEIEQMLDLGVTSDRMIFANPAKPSAYIKVGVKMMTLDSREELLKIHEIYPKADLIIRLATSDKSAMTPLSGKFGAEGTRQIPDLLMEAKKLGQNIAGISFHVGSGCRDPTSFRRALEQVKTLYDFGKSLGHSMQIIDIGGGFPGGKLNANFEDCAKEIRDSLRDYFSTKNVQVLAEPGRYFSAAPFTLCANVIHSMEVPPEYDETRSSTESCMKYYLNDGVFGSFACKFNLYLHSEGVPLNPKPDRPNLRSTIFGPTCDTWDKIEEDRLIEKMNTDEWIYYIDMGAYSCACASNFNGFRPPEHLFAISQENWERVQSAISKRPIQ